MSFFFNTHLDLTSVPDKTFGDSAPDDLGIDMRLGPRNPRRGLWWVAQLGPLFSCNMHQNHRKIAASRPNITAIPRYVEISNKKKGPETMGDNESKNKNAPELLQS